MNDKLFLTIYFYLLNKLCKQVQKAKLNKQSNNLIKRSIDRNKNNIILLKQQKMLNESDKQKKKSYENKIMQFMTTGQSSDLLSKQMQRKTKERQKKQDTLKQSRQRIRSTQQRSKINTNKSQEQNNPQQLKKSHKKQQQRNSIKSYGSKSINRKVSLYGPNHNKQQQQPNMPLAHKQLLSQIQQRIQIINQKITSSISKQQNYLLNYYGNQIKIKQQQLNKLRLITNAQMIKQKTIERKQQLKREKQNLIQGNHYYNTKLEQLKNTLNRLIQKRDNDKKTLNLLMMDKKTSLITPAINQIDFQKSKKKPVYFNNEDFVQKVLKKYNQKSQILNESLTQSHFKKSQYDIPIQSRNNESTLPKILQKNYAISKSINPQYQSSDFYSFRKIKKKFDRAKSTGIFENNQSSIQSKARQNTQDIDGKLNKFARFFRYNKFSKDGSQLKSLDNSKIEKEKIKQNLIEKSRTKNSSEIINPKYQKDSLQYQKQYLQQFVIKKTAKQIFPKNTFKEKTDRSLQNLLQKQKIMKQQLQAPLKIQVLFKQSIQQYYKFKQRQKKRKTQQAVIAKSEQQEQPNLDQKKQQANKQQTAEQIDNKKMQKMLQMSEFDKKIIMDLLLNQYNFKRYVYDLICDQIQSGGNSSNNINVQKVMKNFDHSIYQMAG